jgi:hypothetical protein
MAREITVDYCGTVRQRNGAKFWGSPCYGLSLSSQLPLFSDALYCNVRCLSGLWLPIAQYNIHNTIRELSSWQKWIYRCTLGERAVVDNPVMLQLTSCRTVLGSSVLAARLQLYSTYQNAPRACKLPDRSTAIPNPWTNTDCPVGSVHSR